MKQWLRSLFASERVEVVYKHDLREWEDGDAKALNDFLKTDFGQYLLAHLIKYQINSAYWGNGPEGSPEVARGVKLAYEHLLVLSQVSGKKATVDISDNEFNTFLSNRMGIFKSN